MLKIAASILVLSTACFAAADSTVDTAAGALRPGGWGLGVRPFGTTTSVIAYRNISPRWTEMLRCNWSSSNSDHNSPSGNSTTTTTYDFSTDTTVSTSTTAMDTETVAHSHSITVLFAPEYDVPLRHNLDFTADVGPIVTGSWSTTEQWISVTGTTTHSYVRNWALGGGLQGALGFRWWFLPKSLALAGEFENRITETYTSAHANSRTETTTTATSYTSKAVKTTSIGSGTWALSATTYTCALGLDAFF